MLLRMIKINYINKEVCRMKKIVLLMMLGVMLLSACSSDHGGIGIHEAWARSAMSGETTGVYMIVHNHSDEDDVLIGAFTDIAGAAEIHLSEVNNDVMTMTHIESIDFPAGSEVVFENGGYHIMLVGLKQDLHVGDEFALTLKFEHHGDQTVTVTVKESGGENHSHP